jgi:hypothetical protein
MLKLSKLPSDKALVRRPTAWNLRMRRRLVALAATASMFGIAPALAPVSIPVASPAPAVAKPCSSGWTHAALPWGHKCLRRGQFCKGGQDRAYHRFGFHCHNRDARGNYHLN